MVAIRSLLLAKAFAGLSAAAQVGIAAVMIVYLPAACLIHAARLVTVPIRLMLATKPLKTLYTAGQAWAQPAAGHPTTAHWRRCVAQHGGCTACAKVQASKSTFHRC